MAPDRVLPDATGCQRRLRRRRRDDEELAPGRSGGIGAGLGHGERPHRVLGSPPRVVHHGVPRSPRPDPRRVAALDHEARDDPVEEAAVEVVLLGEEHQTVDGVRGSLRVERELDGAA